MAAFLAKRALWIGAGLFLLVLTLTITTLASVLAGNRIQNAGLSRELSDMTGRRVVYEGQPVIRVFPALTAEFKDFSLHSQLSANDGFPVITAPVMRLSLSMFAALRGETRITAITLEKPVFRAKAENGSWQLPFGGQSRLAKQIGEIGVLIPQEQYEAILSDIAANAFGKITINNGSIIFDPNSNDLITGVNGAVIWPAKSRSAGLHLQGTWRGQIAKFEVTSDDLVSLALGADAGIGMMFNSAPLTTSFSGKVRLQPAPFVEGLVVAKAASPMEAASWLGLKTPYEFSTLGLTLSGALKGELDKWQLEDSALTWGANRGSGGLIFLPNLSPPMLSGTLDFETLDLAMLTQFFAGTLPPRQKNEAADPPAIGADLRISATKASFGALDLNKVAASVQISKLANTLDIHDAAAFGGTLQMALKSQNDADTKTELRILGYDIETRALASLGTPFDDLPQTRGSLSAILTGKNIGDSDFFETAEGTVKFRLGAGTIPGLDADEMVRALRKRGFFALAAKAPSLLSFTEISAEASLAQGTLQFAPLRIGLSKAAFNLTGAYAVKDRSIALTGTLDLEAGHPEAPDKAESLKVFFGGNRDAPLMSGLEGNP